MRIIPFAIALVMLAGCDQPAPPKPPAPPQSSAPSQSSSSLQEVRAFVQRRTDCQHWAGEEGYDAARRAEINAAYTKLRCATLAADEAELKTRHGGNKAALQLLNQKPN